MALSMTGYGRGVQSSADYSITIDIKAVNHRYLETYFRIPKAYSFLEDKLRREISTRISRGKLEIIVSLDKLTADTTQVELNESVLDSYQKALIELRNRFQIQEPITFQSIVGLPNLFNIIQPQEDQEILEKLAIEALVAAITSLMEMRAKEGNGLVQDLKLKIADLTDLRSNLLVFAPEVVKIYQEKLSKRIQELTEGIDVDPGRIATEVAILADKSDITEELVRLESHLQQFFHYLDSNEPVGRRLDFIVQELNREINTVGSKANDLRIAQTVIDFKVGLEKIREQIQNIE